MHDKWGCTLLTRAVQEIKSEHAVKKSYPRFTKRQYLLICSSTSIQGEGIQ